MFIVKHVMIQTCLEHYVYFIITNVYHLYVNKNIHVSFRVSVNSVVSLDALAMSLFIPELLTLYV